MKYQGYLGVFTLLFGLLTFACPVKAEKPFQVIVNFENPNETIKIKKMKKIFLGRIKAWPKSKNMIALVDLPDDSSVKEEFSKKILGKSLEYMSAHWQKQVFGARGRAPKNVSSDKEAIQYIAQEPDAVGYIAGSVKLSEPNIKPLAGKSSKSSGDLSW
ncbi:MAG: hypothetical protein D3924_14630 [Candidatus Electrothrix sp. AR4]|nr:hypothetical protein [Candidatus Electrothrix sp. AR4]